MTSLARRLLVLVIRRFRWVVLGAVLRSASRRSRERTVDDATAELSRRLPQSMVTALDSAPGDLLRAGGGAVAAGRRARRVGSTTRRVGAAAARARRRWNDRDAAMEQLRRDWRADSDDAERLLWADYHRARGDSTAADEALLDRRDRTGDVRPLPTIADPVPVGRPRVRQPDRTVVGRVQRTYRRVRRPWD